MTARLVRWIAVAVILVGLSCPLVLPHLTHRRVSWGEILTLLGLVLDVLGAVLLSWGVVVQPADDVARAPFVYTWGSKPKIWRDPFLWIALRLGNRFIAVDPGRSLQAFEDSFSGVVLLILGFCGQALGQIVTAGGVRGGGSADSITGAAAPITGPEGGAANWAIVGLTAALVVVTGYYAWQNRQTVIELREQRRETIRLQQYERRAAILHGVIRGLGPVLRDARVGGDVIPCLLEATAEKEYLLDAELCRYLDEIYRRAVDAWANQASWHDLPPGEPRTRLVTEHAQMIAWFVEQPRILRERFLPYLKIGV